MPAKVKRVEYDPNRSAFIALSSTKTASSATSSRRRPQGRRQVIASAGADIKPGNCLPFANIPVGTIIHNIELYPGKRRAARAFRRQHAAQLMAKENGYAQVRLPSGEIAMSA
jgi:large subunit ribosomal protein L2